MSGITVESGDAFFQAQKSLEECREEPLSFNHCSNGSYVHGVGVDNTHLGDGVERFGTNEVSAPDGPAAAETCYVKEVDDPNFKYVAVCEGWRSGYAYSLTDLNTTYSEDIAKSDAQNRTPEGRIVRNFASTDDMLDYFRNHCIWVK